MIGPAGKPVGAVQAVFSLAHEQRAVAAMERRVLAVSIATSALLLGVRLLLARKIIVRPLARLATGANALARDDRAEDVGPCGYRTLDVNAPPHDVDGLKVLTYFVGFHMHQRVHVERDPKHKIL